MFNNGVDGGATFFFTLFFFIDRRLRSIDASAKTLKEPWCTNITTVVHRYLNELDDLMYHVVATGHDMHGQRSITTNDNNSNNSNNKNYLLWDTKQVEIENVS